jgi:hypothetical protein
MTNAIYWARAVGKEGNRMKNRMTIKGAYLGAGAGLVLFAVFGLLPGSLVGGAIGIKAAGLLFGLPLESGIVARMIVLAGMLSGVLVAGLVVVTACSTVGWLAGRAVEAAAQHQMHEVMGHR